MVHLDRYHNGVKLVSATELPTIIAKPFLDYWRLKLCHCATHINSKKSAFKPAELLILEKMGKGHCGHIYADQVRDDAGDLGTAVHEIVEKWYSSKVRASDSTEASIWANKIIDQLELLAARPIILKPEESIVDTESGLAGSPDAVIAANDPKHSEAIVDYKIKGTLDDLTGMQGAAYRYLIKRKFKKDIRWMLILWCQKNTVGQGVKPVWIDLNLWETPFMCLVALWNVLNPKRSVTLFQ